MAIIKMGMGAWGHMATVRRAESAAVGEDQKGRAWEVQQWVGALRADTKVRWCMRPFEGTEVSQPTGLVVAKLCTRTCKGANFAEACLGHLGRGDAAAHEEMMSGCLAVCMRSGKCGAAAVL